MKTHNFIKLLGFSAFISITAAALFSVLSKILPHYDALAFPITLTSFVFLIYCHYGSPIPGKIITAMAVIGTFSLSIFFSLSLTTLAIVAALSLWIARCCYTHTRLISVLIDLGMSIFSIVISFWAVIDSGSLFLAFWSFFLVQSISLLITKHHFNNNPISTDTHSHNNPLTKFDVALRQAEYALKKSSSLP